MQRRVGHAVIESIAAEIPKFTAPMLLVHGLWCTAAVWHTFMGYFAHRGWTCHALNLRGRAAPDSAISIGRVRFADYLEDVRGMIAACDAEAYNCAEAMRKAAGRVKQSLEAQQNEINARYAALTRRRDELTTLLHARRLTDDAIGNLVQFRRDTEDGMRHAADEDKRRIFELLDVNVQARNGEAETINCVIGNCTLQNAIRLRLDVLCRAPRLHNGSWTAHSTA